MNEIIDDAKIDGVSSIAPVLQTVVEDSIASRMKEITKRPKRERSPSRRHSLTIDWRCTSISLSSTTNSATRTESEENQRGRTEITR